MAQAVAPLDFFDPHFHVWDVTDAGPHDGSILFKPCGKGCYNKASYEADVSPAGAGQGLKHVGGVFIEASSVSFGDASMDEFTQHCFKEHDWADEALKDTSATAGAAKLGLDYLLVPSLPLEAPGVQSSLKRLQQNPAVRGIREILNYKPSWPRNDKLGNLLKNGAFCRGFAALEDVNFSFDMQLNPHQFDAAAELVSKHPSIPVIINHFGCPTLAELKGAETAKIYWDGIAKLAKCTNTYMQISMLCYVDPEWDSNETIISAVHKMIALFGVNRCFFASNFPVDVKDGWPAARLFPAFLQLAAKYPVSVQKKLFAENAKKAYRWKE